MTRMSNFEYSVQVYCTGKGSCLTIDGVIEMDASIMDGSTLQAGGVACIQNVLNPIKVARLVMDEVGIDDLIIFHISSMHHGSR